MTGVIFIIQNGQLIALKEQSLAKEDIFQSLLAEHPALLASEQMNAQAPRRWLLISGRERDRLGLLYLHIKRQIKLTPWRHEN